MLWGAFDTRLVLRGTGLRNRDNEAARRRCALWGEQKGWRFGSRGGGRLPELPEPLALQNIVGHGVPSEHDGGLGEAAHGELPQALLAEPGIDAFVDRTLAIGRLAGVARHALAPGRHARLVVLARRERVGFMIADGRVGFLEDSARAPKVR